MSLAWGHRASQQRARDPNPGLCDRSTESVMYLNQTLFSRSLYYFGCSLVCTNLLSLPVFP